MALGLVGAAGPGGLGGLVGAAAGWPGPGGGGPGGLAPSGRPAWRVPLARVLGLARGPGLARALAPVASPQTPGPRPGLLARPA